MLANLLVLGFSVFTAGSLVAGRGAMLFKGVPITPVAPRTWVYYLAIAAAVAAIYLASRRSTYLPFLGSTAFPHGALMLDSDEAAAKKPVKVTVALQDAAEGAMVVYWASSPPPRPDATYPTPEVAYYNTSNVGVTKVKDGAATFALECPAEYMVRGALLRRHVHYRVQSKRGAGLFGPVRTLYLDC